MTFKSILSALTAATLCVGLCAATPSYSEAADEVVRILAVGDSITDGYINTDNGYRKYLCYYLQQNGIDYDMVGPNNSWSETATYNWNGTTITYDPAHAGNSGYSIMSYSGRTGCYENLFSNTYYVGDTSSNMIAAYAPDIILLQIGTNDLLDARLEAGSGSGDITETTSALERLETLVDEILGNMDSDAVLFVSTIPDIDAATRYDWLSAYSYIYGIDTYNDIPGLTAKVDECVDAYNAGVEALVAEKQAAGYSVQLGDVHSCIDIAAGDLEDGVHPSEQGYARMGAHWAEKITSYLGGTAVTPTEPATEEPTTEAPSEEPTEELSTEPTEMPTEEPTEAPTTEPTEPPTDEPTTEPTEAPTDEPTTEVLDTPLIADVNGDGECGVLDIIMVQKHLLTQEPMDAACAARAELTGDGVINCFDLALLKRYVLLYTPMPL